MKQQMAVIIEPQIPALKHLFPATIRVPMGMSLNSAGDFVRLRPPIWLIVHQDYTFIRVQA